MEDIFEIECENCNSRVKVTNSMVKGIHPIQDSIYMYFKCPICGDIYRCCKNEGESQYRMFMTLTDISDINLETIRLDLSYSGWNRGLVYKGYEIQFDSDRDTWINEIKVSDLSKAGCIYEGYGNRSTSMEMFLHEDMFQVLKGAIEFIDKKINS